MKNISILIADDHNLVRQGLVYMVKSFPFVESVHGVNNGKEVLEHLKKHRPNLILMDLDMPVMDGMDASETVLSKYPDVKIIVLSGFNDDNLIYHAIQMGVNGYLLKDTKSEDLRSAIKDVMVKGFHYNDMVVRIMRRGIINDTKRPEIFPKQELTEREKHLLKLLCQEKTTKEIAEVFFLSDRTVEKIRMGLASKLNVKGTAGLVKFAVKNGYDI